MGQEAGGLALLETQGRGRGCGETSSLQEV